MAKISLFDMLKALKEKKYFILIFVLLFSIISAVFSWFLNEELYKSTSTLTYGVEDTRDTSDINEITGEPIKEKYIRFGTNSVTNESFEFYNELLQSSELLEEVIDSMDTDISKTELRESITLENPESSGTLLLTVKTGEYKNTDEITNEVVSVFKKMNFEITEMDNIKIIDKATEPLKVDTINIKLNIIISIIIGLIIGVFLIITVEFFKSFEL